MKNTKTFGSAKPTFSSAKLIVSRQSKIVNTIAFAVLLCLFFSGTAWGQSSTLDVYSSATSTNEYVPFYGYYADATQRNQMIYPSSELSSMVGKEITKMEFYISSVSGSGNIGDWIVSLGETAATSLTGLDNSTTLTEVYSGAMTFVSNDAMMTVTFTNGYVYNGGNLLVEFNHPNTAGYKHYYFTGQSVTGASYCYSGQRNFLPKVTFTYQNPPSCAKPTGLTATLTPGNGTIADLSWTENGTATNWVVEYATNSSFTGVQTKNVSGTSSTQLTGLTAETTYYARVKANCGGGDESDWSSTCEFLPTNVYAITVNDGSTTNGYVPIYGYYVDSYTKSQFIIPSTDLSAIQYGTITKLTFYSSNDNINWGSALFEVYMTELGETTLSSIADWSSLDKVMNAASLEISGGQMSVTLDAPYQYMGGNLMIGFLQTNTGSYVSCSWYGVSATGASMGGYGNSVDNNSSVSQQNFLPKTTIEYTPGVAPTCPKPRDLTFVSATATTATISWTAGASETQWQYSIDGGVNWTLVSTTSATLSNLTSNTQYTVLVRAYCSSSDQSGTISETFTTDLCDPEDMCEISIELTDAYGDGGGSIQVINSSTSDVLGSYTLDDDSETYTLSVCNGAPLSFVYASTDSWSYENGFVITDPNGDVIVEHIGCSSSGNCSAPTNGEVATYTMSCPTCRKPINLAVSEAMTGATITWEASGYGESGYQYIVVPTGNTPNWNSAISTTTTSATLSGLTAATTYDVYVRSDCGGGDYSSVIIKTFTTTFCEPEYMCEIKYRLIDESGDGWEGNAINVVDDATGVVLATLTVDDGAYATGTLALCDDRDISFVWVSGTDDYETSYTVIDAWGEEIFSGSGAMASTFNYTMQCPSCHTPSNPVLSNITTNTVSVAWGPAGDYEVRYRPVQDPVLFEDFEDGLPSGWTTVDNDGDGYDWYYVENTNSYSGNVCMTSASYQSGVLYPDNWLISPQVQLGGYVSFWAVGQDPAWPLEHFAIYVSTTGTDPANFTQVSEEFLAYGEYTRYTADLSSYSGMGYIAIRHFNVSNMFRLNIDDFGVYANEPWIVQTTDEPSYTLTNLLATTEYELQVRKDCGGEYSFWSDALVFTTPCNVNAGFPWSEDFEGLSTDYTIPDCWDNKESTCGRASYKWSYTTSSDGNTNGTGHNGSKCVRFDSYNCTNGQTNMLKTPLLDLATVPVATLKFWYKNEDGGDFSVYVSTNGGVTYTNTLATGLNSSSWTECTYDLTPYCGHNNVEIVFKGTSNASGYIYIDDVSVTAPRTVVVSGEAVCSGKETTLTAVTGAFSNPYFTWSASPSEGAGLPDDLTTSEITVIPTSGGTYTYICSVTEGGAGEATVGEIELTMKQTPTASIEGTNPLPVCVFTQVTLNASGAGDGGSYAWDNELGSGASKTITVTEAKNYTVTVTDANTCTARATKSVTIKIPGNLPSTYSPEPGIIWTGYESTDWDDQRNWLFFNGDNYTPIVEDLDSTLSVVLRTGGTEQCIMHDPVINNPEFDANAGMTVRRNITVANGTELNIGGALTLEGGTLTLGGSTYLAVGDTVLIADGASVSFSASDTLVVSGNFTLSGNINFVDQGLTDNEDAVDDPTDALVIGGDLIINGASTFSPAGGSIVFARNSGTRRVYNNTGRPLEFFKVELDDERTRSGVPHTVFPDGTIIKYTAIFSYGIWDGDLIFAKTGNALVKGGFESYASGNITKIGKNKSFSFPTGGNDVLGSIAAKIPTDVQVSAKFNSKTGGYDQEHDGYPRWWNNNDMCDDSKDLNHVSNYEYWTLRANTTTTLTDLTFTAEAADRSSHFNPASSEDEAVNEEAIRLAMYNGCWKNLGGADNVIVDDGKIEIEIPALSLVASGAKGIADDPIITLGSTTKTTILPIELTSFTATCDGRSSLIEWSTASERNNDYFSLERSDDAINFTEVARIAGAGNSIEPLDYAYNDYGIHGGDNYYRLVQVDYDGTRTVSEVIVANCVESATDGEPEVEAYPNPFSSDLTVVLDNFGNRVATIEVYDMLGKLIYTNKIYAPQNSYETILNLSNLPSGAYTVRVSTNDFVINRNVVKQ